MSYGVKYRADYDTITGVTCRVEILKKDYEGGIYPLELSGNPVIQNYQTDEPRAPIKGCSLTLSLHNTGSIPITTFYSVNDDEYKVIHYKNGQITFVGFLVQDDCREEMVDYRHEIILSANDNIGLLKDVAFGSKLPDSFIYDAVVSSEVAFGRYYVYIKNSAYVPMIGKYFTVAGHTDPLLNDTFLTLNVATPLSEPFFYQIEVSKVLPDIFDAPVTIDSAIDLYGRNPLSEIIRLCLFATGLDLDIYVYCNLFEDTHYPGKSCFEQTIVDAQTFLKDQVFMNCYDILESIFNRFNITLFQESGVWNLFRTDELRYGNVNGFIYSPIWNLIGTTTLSDTISFGFGQQVYPETAPVRSIIRPFKFVKETFNYEQPKYLLKNYDLQDLGALLRSYTEGTGADIKYISEYVATDWLPSGFIQPDYFIRVIKDSTDTEVDRYLVIKGFSGDTARSVQGSGFEVSALDKIEFTFNFRTVISQTGFIGYVFAVQLYNFGLVQRYANEDPANPWKIGIGWNYNVNSGDNSNVYHAVTINPGPIIFNGVVNVFLPQADLSNSADGETHIKDIRLTYTPYINSSTKIIGQYHLNEQNENIKNTNDETIYLDDTPRNSLKGTMFLVSSTDILQNRTTLWYRNTNNSERLRLGYITTLEELFLRRRPRTKIEGNYIGIEDIGMLSKIKYSPLVTFNFIFGMLEINYKSNSFKCTLFELFEDGEVDSDLVSNYTFQYLYNTK